MAKDKLLDMEADSAGRLTRLLSSDFSIESIMVNKVWDRTLNWGVGTVPERRILVYSITVSTASSTCSFYHFSKRAPNAFNHPNSRWRWYIILNWLTMPLGLHH